MMAEIRVSAEVRAVLGAEGVKRATALFHVGVRCAVCDRRPPGARPATGVGDPPAGQGPAGPADVSLYTSTVGETERPDDWLAATVEAPLLIVPYANKDAYLDRYALPDKGFADRSDEWWPAPYWDIDTGFAALLMLLTAVDAGLGACFFGFPADRIGAFRQAFGVPPRFTPTRASACGLRVQPP